MSQQVQELINKIKAEGMEAAQQKSKEIEAQAQKNAQKIIEEAGKEAQQIILDARQEVKKLQESTHMALKQASRDMLLSLRKEIQNTLHKIIAKHIHEALAPEQLAHIIGAVVQKSLDGKSDIHVALNPHDLEKLRHGFIAKLQHEIKQPLKFESSEDIGSGFTISFDGGKSSFEFTDVSLAEYLAKYLNPQVAALVKEAALS